MVFILRDEHERVFMGEQANLPDRIIGLLYPILIDTRLEALIKSRWKDDSKGSVLEGLFRDGDALGSFDTRVKIGFAIGLYGEDILNELRWIVKIRNAFAHKHHARDFESQPVCNFVNKLDLLNKYPKEDIPSLGIADWPHDRQKWIQSVMRHSGLKDLTPRRTRYLRSIEIILTWLAIESGELEGLIGRLTAEAHRFVSQLVEPST